MAFKLSIAEKDYKIPRSTGWQLYLRHIIWFIMNAKVDCSDSKMIVTYAAFRRLPDVKKLVESTNVYIDSTDETGKNALCEACENGDSEMVDYLLSKGADVNFIFNSTQRPSWNGATPLYYATKEGHVDIAKTLIQKGANLDVETCKFNLMTKAVWSKNPKMVEYLLNLNFGIDDYDPDGNTPLIAAIRNSCHESETLLLEKGADYRKPRPNEYPMILFAARAKDSAKGMEILLKHVEAKEGREGVKEYVNQTCPKTGCTALHCACIDRNFHSIKLLLEYEIDYKIEDVEGRRAEFYIPKSVKYEDLLNLFRARKYKEYMEEK